jgi:hypothetical protein
MRLSAIALGFIVPFASGLTIEDAKKWSVVMLFDQPVQPRLLTDVSVALFSVMPRSLPLISFS